MTAAAVPFALGDGPDACLLLHGLTGAPSELRPLGEALASAGFRAVAPLLPGHGTTPAALARVTRADLLAAAAAELAALRDARRVFVAGLSAGGLLALRLAAAPSRAGVPPVAALALLAPAIRFARGTWVFSEVLGRIPAPLIVRSVVIGKGRRDLASPAPGESAAAQTGSSASPPSPVVRADGSYSAIPLSWAHELHELSGEGLRCAPDVRAPTLLLHGGCDRTAALSGTRLLAGRLGSNELRLRVFPQSGHVLPLDRDSAAVCSAVVSFFREAST